VLDLRDEQAEAAGIHGDVEFPCGGHLAFPVVAGEEQGAIVLEGQNVLRGF
jgi:hypothetical protein